MTSSQPTKAPDGAGDDARATAHASDGMQRPDDSRALTWVRRGAIVSYIALGCAATAIAVRIVVLSYSPLPFADMWNEIPFVRLALHGDAGLGDWWAQHNEHRIVLPRLQFIIDYGLFHGRGVFLLTMIFLSCVALALVMTWPFASVWNDRVVTVGFACFAVAATLTPADWENLTWFFQVGSVQVYLFGISAIAVVANGELTFVSRRRTVATAGVAAIAATAATLSDANGLLAWPALVFAAAARRLRWALVGVFASAGIVETTAYLWHFKPVPVHTPYSHSLAHPFAVVHYIATYLGRPAQPLGLNAATALGGVGIFIFGVFVLRAAKSGQTRDYAPITFAAAAGMFVVLTAGETAIGRLDFGISQALASRYAIASSAFWIAVAIGLAPWIASSVRLTVGRVRVIDLTAIIFVAACLTVALVIGLLLRPSRQTLVETQSIKNVVVAGFSADVNDSKLLRSILAPPSALTDLMWLKRERLGPWSDPAILSLRKSRSTRIRDVRACGGHLDLARSISGGERYEGWVVTASGGSRRSFVEVVNAEGRTNGVGYVGMLRPDVKNAGASTSNFAGFVAFARGPIKGLERIVLLDKRTMTPTCVFPLPTT
jgi:hypothetical protein